MSLVSESLVRLDMRVASPRCAQLFLSGPFLCPELGVFNALGLIKLDVRGASPHSSAWQGYFSHALVMNAQVSLCLKSVSDLRLWQKLEHDR